MSASVISVRPMNNLHFNLLTRGEDEMKVLIQNQNQSQSTNYNNRESRNRESRDTRSIADENSPSSSIKEDMNTIILEMKSDKQQHQLAVDLPECEDHRTNGRNESLDDEEQTRNLEISDDELMNQTSKNASTELIGHSATPVTFDSMRNSINIPHKGIHNLGNTCYLASALQMLLSVEGFVKDIIKSYLDQKGSNECRLRDALAIFFISSLEQDTNSNSNHLDPSALKKVVDDITNLFAGYFQQDAHEFLSTILDVLHDEIAVKEDEKDNNRDDDEAICHTNNELRDCSMHSLRTTEGDEFTSEHDFVLVNVCEKRLDALESDTKKARLSRPHSPALSKTPSFSELNFDGINSLLHGTMRNTRSQFFTHAPNSDHLKLIGGHLATESSTMQMIQNDASCESSSLLDDKTSKSQYHQSLCTDNPVDNYFAMEVQTHLTCDSCSHRSSHLEVYRHLSIEVGNNEDDPIDENSVMESLRSFFAPEKRNLKCEKCFSDTATQTTEIMKLPRALILHLKRFIVDVSPNYASISYKKNMASIDFPEKLDLKQGQHNSILADFLAADVSYPEMEYIIPEKDDSEQSDERNDNNGFVKVPKGQYHLRSIVNHIGSSANCGHYTADALRLYPSSQSKDGESSTIRKWTRFNDDFVSLVDHHQAMESNAQKSAYMILYAFE